MLLLAETGTPTNVYLFSAICYLFGVHMYGELGYHVGLVQLTRSGTGQRRFMATAPIAQCYPSNTIPEYVCAAQQHHL